MACAVIGDSIAVGVGLAAPECWTVAKVGISSGAFVAQLLPRAPAADQVVISLGVNDGASDATLEHLRIVRARFQAARVCWLLPGLRDRVRALIHFVALERGDAVIDVAPWAGPDRIHPRAGGYRALAAMCIPGVARRRSSLLSQVR